MLFARFFHRHSAKETYLRNFIFGVEDSLVSTVGLLAGVASSGVAGRAILTTGLVLIVVEGLSMGIGSFLSEETTEEMSGRRPNNLEAIYGALTMFISYFLAGFIPLFPYIILTGQSAVSTSVAFSLFGLAALGYGTARYFDRPSPWRRGLKMFLLGGAAVLAGMLIGKLFHL